MELIVTDGENLRIDKYISKEVTELTRTNIQKLLENGHILVNQEIVKSNYKVKENDIIAINKPQPVVLEAKPEEIPLDIVYEDEYLLVVNKPKGMVVHPACGNYEGTLVNALMAHCKGSLSEINGVIRPGIVHRIDKDTSGLLLVAKDNETHLFLAGQIKEHKVNRDYLAITEGVLKDDQGTINAPIGRNPKDRKKMAIVYKNSKDAITHYKVLERFTGHTYIECMLETGRTHQIRVHIASLGKPILGDMVYGRAKNKFGVEGQMLHAYKISFEHPKSHQIMEFRAQLPNEFKKILEKLKKI